MRKTPQCACIVRRRSCAISGTDSPDAAPSSLASRARDMSAASAGNGLCGTLPRFCPTMKLPAARPNTMRSISELVPSRLAPCTDTHAHSPTA